jgi:hypothetical protein
MALQADIPVAVDDRQPGPHQLRVRKPFSDMTAFCLRDRIETRAQGESWRPYAEIEQ